MAASEVYIVLIDPLNLRSGITTFTFNHMITISPYGGLGNRMRALDSVFSLIETPGEKIRLIWKRTDSLNCRFGDLFLIPEFVDLVEKNKFLTTSFNRNYSKIVTQNLLNLGSFLGIGYDKVFYENEISLLKKKTTTSGSLIRTALSI